MTERRLCLASSSILLCLACAAPPAPSAPPPSVATASPTAVAPASAAAAWSPEDSADGVESAALGRLLQEHWAWTMQQFPTWATRLGIRRFDDRLTDGSADAIAARRAEARAWVKRARELASAGLSPADATTLRLFLEGIEYSIAGEVCEFHEWSVDPRSNPITVWNRLPKLHLVKTPEHARTLLKRYEGIAKTIDDEIDNLKLGAAKKTFANAHSAKLVRDMVKKQLEQPSADWPMASPAKEAPEVLSAEEKKTFSAEVLRLVEKSVRPALVRYHAYLEKNVLPSARGADAEGLGGLPQGQACYEAQIRRYTTVEKTADQIHQTGVAELDRINAEMAALGKKLFRARSFAATVKKLRTDRSLYFSDAESIVKKAETALGAARAKIPEFFGVLPKADCVVLPTPDYEAPTSTIAYYRQPNPDGSKPGEYFVNTYKPETRPRFEAEVLAFHESIPGHHLQIAISQELSAMPAFRKHAGMTAFVEGWGLYTERLADEMGLYTGDLDRLGMLSFEAWRAARLVVDTGLHAKGWTRARAQKLMLDRTALTEINVKNEVDRYIVWPGQALAYKTGQLEIFRLRAWAKKELGEKFRLRDFHDVVLGRGAVSLPVLELQVKDWVRASSSTR